MPGRSNDAADIRGFVLDFEAEVDVRIPFEPGLDFVPVEGASFEVLLRVDFVEPFGLPRVAEPEGRGGLKGLGGIAFASIEWIERRGRA
jgi:hypothetical protein